VQNLETMSGKTLCDAKGIEGGLAH
jgi:hypothetical protein